MLNQLQPTLNPFDKLVEVICLSLLVLLWLGTIISYSKLPDQIPNHFNASGIADAWDGKESIWILIAIATAIYLLLTFIGRQSSWHKQISTNGIQDKEDSFRQSSRLLRVIKLAVLIIFSGILFNTFRVAMHGGDGLGKWFLPMVIILMIVPNLIYLIRTFQGNRKAVEQQ